MKTFLLAGLILFSVSFLSTAQKDSIQGIYKTWVTLNDNSQKIRGMLYETKDSSIVLTNSLSRSSLLRGGFGLTIIDYRNIAIIKNRKNNRVLYSFLGGITLGFAVGAFIGYSQGDDTCPADKWCIFQMTARDKLFAGGALGAILGAGTGTAIGLVKVKIPIFGNFEKYNNSKTMLKNYSYIH